MSKTDEEKLALDAMNLCTFFELESDSEARYNAALHALRAAYRGGQRGQRGPVGSVKKAEGDTDGVYEVWGKMLG